MTRFLYPFVLVFGLAAHLHPQESRPNIAVMDLEGNGITQNETAGLSNRLRSELFNTGRFNVIERGQMTEILEEQKFQLSGCTSSECMVEMGQLLGVKYMVAGSVDRLGRLYTANIRLVNVENGRIEKTAVEDCRNCELEDVAITTMRAAAGGLAGVVRAKLPAAPPAPVKQPPPALPLKPAPRRDTAIVSQNPPPGALMQRVDPVSLSEFVKFKALGLPESAWGAYESSGLSMEEYRDFYRHGFTKTTWAQYKETGLGLPVYRRHFGSPKKWAEYKKSGLPPGGWVKKEQARRSRVKKKRLINTGILALAAGASAGGFFKNKEYNRNYQAYKDARTADQSIINQKWSNVEKAKFQRNIFYGAAMGLVGASLVVSFTF